MAYTVSGKFSDGGSWTASAPSNSGNQLVTVVADENISTSDRTISLLVQNASGGVCTVSVTQEKAVYTYDFTLNPFASMLGAEGGTTKVRGTLVTYRSGVQVSSETVVPTLSGSADGFSISGDVVTAANRGTTAGLVRRITVTGTYSDTFDGQEVSATVVIAQAANGINRVQISTGDGASPITSFSAAGRSNWWYYAYGIYTSGSSARIPDSYSGWSLESVSWASIAPAEGATYAASFNCDSRGSEVGDVRTVELSFTYDGKSDSITISQAANSATALEIREVGDNDLKLNISAAGMYNCWCQLYATYTSGTRSSAPMSDIEWSSSDSAILSIRTLGSTYVAIDVLTRGTEVGSERTADLIAQYLGLETSVTFTQAKNEATTITYGDVSITNYSYSDIPASGGSSSPILTYTQSAAQNYSSGASLSLSDVTSGAALVYSKVGTDGGGSINTSSGVVSVGTRGFTEGPRWEIGVFAVQVSLNGKTGSTHVTCYQAANEIESVKIYSSAGGAAFDGSFPASGGRHFATCRATYSSNYVGELQDGSRVAWSISGTGFSWEPSASYPWAGVVVASDRGIDVGSALSGVLTLTVGALTDSVDLTQAENKIESYNYGAWSISISANPTTIGYGGGSSTISASCSRSKTPVYSSGSTGTVETESVTPTLSGSASGFTLSGTTVTATENQSLDKRSITVTASYSGATSQSVVITQDGIPVYVYVGADQASAVSQKYTITMPMGGSKEAIYFKVSGGSQLVTSDSNDFLVGAAEGIEDAYIASNDLFTLEK